MIGPALRGLTLLLSLALVALAGGFFWFTAIAGQVRAPPPRAGGIVALTGGADRVETALHLLAAGRADLLLVSGVAHGVAWADLARRTALDAAALAPRVTLGHDAETTAGNAQETAAWVADHGIGSLIVVTSGYHMPRALLELGRAMPGVALYPVAAQAADAPEPMVLRRLLLEYGRLLAASCGLSRAPPRPAHA